ncbi:hypothetical protein BG000_006236 [Podila horticola]|nr:hypothetical protein BG000_006236 [Podila horticola]
MADASTDPRTMGDDSSGWYIYVILVITAIIAAVFFGRVCHAKRKERIRAEKDQDCEVPPSYMFHAHDMQVFNSTSRVSVPEQAYTLPSQQSPPAPAATPSAPTLPAINVVSDTSTRSFEPPAYEDLNK